MIRASLLPAIRSAWRNLRQHPPLGGATHSIPARSPLRRSLPTAQPATNGEAHLPTRGEPLPITSSANLPDLASELRVPGQTRGDLDRALLTYALGQHFWSEPDTTRIRVIGQKTDEASGSSEVFGQVGSKFVLLTPQRAEGPRLVETFQPGAKLKGAQRELALSWVRRILAEQTQVSGAITTRGVRTAFATPELERFFRADAPTAVEVLATHSSNTLVTFTVEGGPRFILKVNRSLSPGDLKEGWMNALLATEGFTGSPKTFGSLLARVEGQQDAELSVLQEFLPNLGSVADRLGAELEAVRSPDARTPSASALQLVREQSAAIARLHLTTCRAAGVELMTPRPAVEEDRAKVARYLRRWLAAAEPLSRQLPSFEAHVEGFRRLEREVAALPVGPGERTIPTHTDLHDVQMLLVGVEHPAAHPDAFDWTDSLGRQQAVRWVTLDFGPEPGRRGDERVELGSALEDLAGVLCSKDFLDYDLRPGGEGGRWSGFGPALKKQQLVSYLQSTRGQGLYPESEAQLETLLLTFMLKKTAYEDDYFFRSGNAACRRVSVDRYAELGQLLEAPSGSTTWLREAIREGR